jgi:hypothetical protein
MYPLFCSVFHQINAKFDNVCLKNRSSTCVLDIHSCLKIEMKYSHHINWCLWIIIIFRLFIFVVQTVWTARCNANKKAAIQIIQDLLKISQTIFQLHWKLDIQKRADQWPNDWLNIFLNLFDVTKLQVHDWPTGIVKMDYVMGLNHYLKIETWNQGEKVKLILIKMYLAISKFLRTIN